METEVITSIIAAITALVAVVIGPFIMIRAQKNQMLGPMRQAWINDLRDSVAEYLARNGMSLRNKTSNKRSHADKMHGSAHYSGATER